MAEIAVVLLRQTLPIGDLGEERDPPLGDVAVHLVLRLAELPPAEEAIVNDTHTGSYRPRPQPSKDPASARLRRRSAGVADRPRVRNADPRRRPVAR
jgi:hypothetical protein